MAKGKATERKAADQGNPSDSPRLDSPRLEEVNQNATPSVAEASVAVMHPAERDAIRRQFAPTQKIAPRMRSDREALFEFSAPTWSVPTPFFIEGLGLMPDKVSLTIGGSKVASSLIQTVGGWFVSATLRPGPSFWQSVVLECILPADAQPAEVRATVVPSASERLSMSEVTILPAHSVNQMRLRSGISAAQVEADVRSFLDADNLDQALNLTLAASADPTLSSELADLQHDVMSAAAAAVDLHVDVNALRLLLLLSS